MINLEGIRTLKNEKETEKRNLFQINKIFYNKINFNRINDENKIYSSIQLYKDCQEILNIFGDFSKEKNKFKNTARKGMIFADTKFIINVNINNVIPLEDETNGKYIITDGIGKISKNLIKLTSIVWGKSDKTIKPISAIQIRFMGCKGVLAVDPSLENDYIHIRESQIKYNSNDTALNVCSVANYKEASLNRQFIILLSTLGVKDEIFEKIQKDIIKKYMDLLINSNKNFFFQKSIYNKFKNKLLQFGTIFGEFLEKHINLINEPIFSQFINVFIYSKLIKMKYSGKIKDNKCVCLMGVIDETDTLEQDEVYIHLVNNDENSIIDTILEQKVIVYRSPSLHPGDIEILKAIKKPLLNHMVNVIVFSKKGKRPTFNKLSGGDLDGDRYFVSFNDDIINNIIEENCQPLDDPKYSDFKIENKNKRNKITTIEDSINCMIKTIENSKIGIICNNHIALADLSPLKTKDPQCISLCKYFNTEIDANKTGEFIDILDLKRKGLILGKKPDFLTNGISKKNKCYESPGILGKLYREINKKNELYDNFRFNFFKKVIRRDYEININFITKNSFIYLSDAYKIYNDYKIKLCNLMKKYNFCTEGELFLNFKIFKHSREDRGKKNSHILELKELLNYITNEIQKIFGEIDIDIASAIYIASYINVRRVYEKSIDFSNDFDENLAKLLSLFEKEKNEFKILFKDYSSYANLKQNNRNENKNKYKRIFSLPWIIKEIRENLLSILKK